MTGTSIEDSAGDGRRKRILEWLNRKTPTDPRATLTDALWIRNALVEEFAQRLEPAVNRIMESISLDSYESKRSAAKAITVLMRGYGLCFRCPKTHEPTVLIGGIRDNSRGRFQFMNHRSSGRNRQVRTFSAVRLPALELIPEPSGVLANALEAILDPPNHGRSR